MSDTFHPDADPERGSVDGHVVNSSAASSWSALHDAASGTSALDSLSLLTAQIAASNASDTDKWDSIIRAFLLFDTSSLPDGAVVTSANLGIYVSTLNNDFGGNLDLVASTPASNTALATADFDQVGTT